MKLKYIENLIIVVDFNSVTGKESNASIKDDSILRNSGENIKNAEQKILMK